MSSNRIRQDTPSTAKWCMITTSCAVEATHSALSITPAVGFNRDRASMTASSDNTSTVCRQSRASTDPASGTCQRPAPGAVIFDAQPQHGMSIQQRLQHNRHIGLGHPDREPAPAPSG